MENNIVQLVETLKTKCTTEKPLFLGEVLATNPISISINKVPLKKNLYIHNSLVVCEEIEVNGIFMETPEDSEKDRLLKKFFESYILKAGDKVVAYQDGLDFYILAKVGM